LQSQICVLLHESEIRGIYIWHWYYLPLNKYLVENCLKLKDIMVPRDCFLLHQWCTILGVRSPWRPWTVTP